MPEYLAPGVYIEETSFRSKSIEGVGTSTCAFVGPTRKGPLNGTPEIITSFAEFERMYGGLENLSYTTASDIKPIATNYLAHAVQAFFNNGGKRLYIARTFIPRTNAGGTITSNGLAAATIIPDDGSGNQAGFIARMPGSGLNGQIRAYEKKSRATETILNSAPEGSLLCTGGSSPAQPAAVTGGSPSFSLNNGDQLGLILSSGTRTITFNGTPAEAVSDTISEPIDIPAGTTLQVSIGGASQSISLPSGSNDFSDILDAINMNVRHGYARLQGGNSLVIGTDQPGSAAQITVSELDILGFTSDTPGSGTGNVADLENVTITEVNALLQAGSIAVQASAAPSTGVLRLSTTGTGSSVSIQIQDNAARVSLGLPTEAFQGSDGDTLLYYEKGSSGWIGGADGVTTLTNLTSVSGDLVTVNLEVQDADNNILLYEDLGFGEFHPRYIGQVLDENPSKRSDALQNPYYIRITGTLSAATLHSGMFDGNSKNSFKLTGGNDGAEPSATITLSGAVSYKDGLDLLEEIEDISIVAAPGHSAMSSFQAVQQALISHAERMRYRFAILDTAEGATISGARDTRSLVDSKYAALYYPWIVVANPLARPGNEQIKKEIALPPSGFMAGIYARTDIERGVWKAPANEVVRGALRFEREINHGQQEVLNPEGINCLRFFFGRGNRVWGARTVSSDPEWKYINVRRYFIFLEHSIDRSTQWAVFEPNGMRLWSNIKATVSDFLYNEWRNGALLGTKPEEAYFVRCDRSTMTQADLDNGRLICEIGVAVLKPAEFVIFRIGQKTADARS